jgi:hypothetical protein
MKKITNCPSWLQLSDDRTAFILPANRAVIVKRIFEMSLAGLGGYTIAKQLNEKGVAAFGPSLKWDQSTIHNMLCNRATIGEYQPNKYKIRKEASAGDPIPNYYPAVIEEGLFLAVQAARRKNLESGRGRKGRYVTNLFPNLIICAHCGGPVKFYSNGNDKTLICVRVFQKQGCYRMAWTCRNFEETFFWLVMRLNGDPATEESERESISKLSHHIRQLEAGAVYDGRMGIAITLKMVVAELKIAAAGQNPVAGRPDARIRRDVPGRYFSVKFQGGTTAHIGRPIIEQCAA